MHWYFLKFSTRAILVVTLEVVRDQNRSLFIFLGTKGDHFKFVRD